MARMARCVATALHEAASAGAQKALKTALSQWKRSRATAVARLSTVLRALSDMSWRMGRLRLMHWRSWSVMQHKVYELRMQCLRAQTCRSYTQGLQKWRLVVTRELADLAVWKSSSTQEAWGCWEAYVHGALYASLMLAQALRAWQDACVANRWRLWRYSAACNSAIAVRLDDCDKQSGQRKQRRQCRQWRTWAQWRTMLNATPYLHLMPSPSL